MTAPCQHIADYYQRLWEQHPCIAYNFLRQGYRAWAAGTVRNRKVNNIF